MTVTVHMLKKGYNAVCGQQRDQKLEWARHSANDIFLAGFAQITLLVYNFDTDIKQRI